jgi:hypothetical protein
MAIGDNLIEKMEFQIQINQDSDFDLLANGIPDIVSEHLETFINDSIEELNLGNQFFILEKLEIDLGVLDIANFKSDLIDKFKRHFFFEIKKQLNKNSLVKIPDEELTFSVFKLFIQKGGRPWWLNNQVKHFGEFAEKAFILKPQEFISLCKTFMKYPVYRKRMIENLPEDLLVRVLIDDKKLGKIDSSKTIYAIKGILKQKYRYWNESKLSSAFKDIVLQLFLYPNRIDQLWKLNLAIEEAIQNNHPEIVISDPLKNRLLRTNPIFTNSATRDLTWIETPDRFSINANDHVLIQGFQFYLENGYTRLGNIDHHYRFKDINTLFRYLISNQLDDIFDLLLLLGRSNIIKKRFLESISQELIDEFFALVAPAKRKLLNWVTEIFQKVQEEYQPINQTFIIVKKSINEITFELFLNKKLTSVTDENYLRFLFKQTARKFGINYRDLLFLTIKSLGKRNSKTSSLMLAQILTAIYTKDILRGKRYFTIDQATFGMDEPEVHAGMADYRSKDFVYDLFLDLYRQTRRGSETKIGSWLKTKLAPMSIANASDLLVLWETLAVKFELNPEQLLLPVLVDKHRNPSIKLSTQSFNFFKNKYKLSGIYARKKPDEFRLIQTLHENKKRLSYKVIKGILMNLKPIEHVEKLDFQLISSLIHSGDTPVLPIYLNWLSKILLDKNLESKKRTVYNWFLQQLLIVPKRDLTLLHLQKKTLRFLQVDEGLVNGEDYTYRKSLSTIEKNKQSKAFHVGVQKRLIGIYPQQSPEAFFRIVEIIGRAEMLGIFPDSQKYGDKILFQILTSKYESQFFSLLKKHQFNRELRDHILIQAPGWLKKDLTNFINKPFSGSWNSTVTSIREYIEKTNWMRLKGLYLSNFIEKVLWDEIFEATKFIFKDLLALVMQQAYVEELVTNQFWNDYNQFKILAGTLGPSGKYSRVNQIAELDGSEFLSYVDALSKQQLSDGSLKQILESILLDFNFPVGHSFEEYQVDEFKPYINKLINSDKKVLIDTLSRVESPLFLQRFLALLDESTLRFLIRENQKRLGFSLPLKKIEAIFSFYKIKDKIKINNFYTAWIGELYFEIRNTSNLSAVYARIFRVLEAEELLTLTTLYSRDDWKPLFKILNLEGKDQVLFFQELGWWSRSKTSAWSSESTEQILGVPLTETNFKSYISDLSRMDKRVVGELLGRVESPGLGQRLLNLLDKNMLRSLIQTQHDILGLPTLLKQIDAVFSTYNIRNNTQLMDFFTSWAGVLYFSNLGKMSRIAVYGRVFRIMVAEGILGKGVFISGIDQKNILDILQLNGMEEMLFLEEFGWRNKDKKNTQPDGSTEQILGVPLTETNFKSYISDLSRMDKRVVGELLGRVESPGLGQRLLNLLDKNMLRSLIQTQHDILGLPTLLKQIDAVFSIYNIRNNTQLMDFLTSWAGVLYFSNLGKMSRIAVYGRVFRIMISEGILGKGVFISGIDQKNILDILQLDRAEEVLFFEELGGYRSGQEPEEVLERTKNNTNDFIDGKSTIELIYYPNKFSFKQYTLLIEYLFEEGFLNYSHRPYIQDWVKFSAHYQSKKYLQIVLQLYLLKNLKAISNGSSVKTLLLCAFLERLNGDVTGLNLFFSRLSYMPSLIKGIPLLVIKGMKSADLKNWKKVWSDVNVKFAIDPEPKEFQELILNLFLNFGKSFLENQPTLRNQIPLISKLICEAPLSELFMRRIHPESFIEFFKIKPAKEIHTYFLQGKDPYLKALVGKEFLTTWFEEFFKNSNEIQHAKFLGLFHKSFYSNVYTNTQRNLDTFLSGFFRLKEAQKSFRNVIEKKPEEMALFYQAYPALFGSVRSGTGASVMVLSSLEIFQLFLEGGLLPKGISGIQQLAKELTDLNGNDLKKLRIVIHAGLQSEKGKQNFCKLANYLDEIWFLKLIYQDLPGDLDVLTTYIRKNTQQDFFLDLRVSKKLDRLIFIVSRWSITSVLVKNSSGILLDMVEKWMDLVDHDVIMQVFSSDYYIPELIITLKNSSTKLKKIIGKVTTAEEKKIMLMPPVKIAPIDYGEGVSIANAGLVLFWPFYGRFFGALGMVGKEGMKSEETRERAIQLLQYIATGKTEFEEWDLTLNKILCGAAPDFPVSPRIDISAEEEELCSKLIKGAIYNWEKMRGTKMETFRETFVAREGRLYEKDNRWELIVGNKAYDVLLDTLSWKIAMINLSWMNTRINVQWR